MDSRHRYEKIRWAETLIEDVQINAEVYLGKYIGQNLEKRMEIINSYMLAAEGGRIADFSSEGVW